MTGPILKTRSLVVVAIAVAAFGLRLDGIGERTFGHPENYVSGLPMPEWVAAPARRVDLSSLYRGAVVDAGHPPLYFAGMLAWTKLFGHSLVALRLPSAILGTASVLLLYSIGARAAGRNAALLASLLLAANGPHVYWSRMARPYVAASFLVLLATWALLRLHERPSPVRAWTYGTTVAAALWTQLYAWPALLVHCIWSCWRGWRARAAPRQTVPLALGLILAMPIFELLAHQASRGGQHLEDPWGYLAFGYALSPVVPFWGEPPAPPVSTATLVGLTLALWIAALAVRARGATTAGTERRPASEFLAVRPSRAAFVGLGSAAAITTFAMWRLAPLLPQRRLSVESLRVTALLPLAIALGTGVVLVVFAGRRSAREIGNGRLGLVAMSAVLSPAVVGVLSLGRKMLVARGTVVFLPYLILLAAVGASALGQRWRAVGIAAATALVLLAGASWRFYSAAASAPRDYAGLARMLQQALEPGDLVLIAANWSDFPLLYYFEGDQDRFVLRGHRRRISAPGTTRVWLVGWTGQRRGQRPAPQALDGFRPTDEVVSAHRAMARLYVRGDAAVPPTGDDRARIE